MMGRSAERDDTVGPRWLAHLVAAVITVCFALTATVGIQRLGFNLDAVPFLLMLAILIGVGWLLAWKRPGNPLGWMLLAVPGIFCSGVPFEFLGTAVRSTAPDATAWLYWYGHDREDTWTWIPPVWLLLTQVPLRFPDGRLPGPGWRWFSVLSIVAVIFSSAAMSTVSTEVAPDVPNPAYVAWGEGVVELLTIVSFGGLLVSFVGAVISLFFRYRRADAVGAAQLRWVFWAVAIAVGVLLISWIPTFAGWGFAQNWVLIVYALIPVSVAVAVLRYRLYDIDRIISRTASYALVTIIVVGSYAIVVVGITAIVPDLPSVAVALATLAAAGLFLPVLHRVQSVVDRRFDRARYNGQKVVDAFGERLRNGADPHTAAVDLSAAVEASLQPASMGLWIAGYSGASR